MIRKISGVLLILAVVNNGTANAQNKQNSSAGTAVKVNLDYRYDRDSEAHLIGPPAPAIMLSTKAGHFHEIELNLFRGRSRTESLYDPYGNSYEAEISEFEAGIRYQLSYRVAGKNSPTSFFLGLSALSYYTAAARKPLTPNAYPRFNRTFNEVIAVVPQMRFSLSERVFLNLDLPLQFFNVEYVFQKIENPMIPLRQQTNAGYEIHLRFVPVFHARLGLGVSL